MSASQAKKIPDQKAGLRRNEQKWTPTLLAAGWTLLPSVILERQGDLGLDAVDVNIILHLARHWWYSENPPRPSKRRIADCMKVDPSTVRRHLARLERRGLISRVPRFDPIRGQQSNTYDMSGLIKAALPFAEEAIAVIAERQANEGRSKDKAPLKLLSD